MLIMASIQAAIDNNMLAMNIIGAIVSCTNLYGHACMQHITTCSHTQFVFVYMFLTRSLDYFPECLVSDSSRVSFKFPWYSPNYKIWWYYYSS